MRGKSPKQILPVEMVEGSFEQSKLSIGPIVVMSGYLTKKARSMNRWLHRWFQLLDNGILQYYLNDKKIKLLGEIDIGKTCYDVHQGAKNCRISFPPVAPKCCCFWFTVLKRSYYMYAPTAIEANKWHESIHSASNVLNRRIVAGVQRRKAPEAPGKENRQQRRSLPLKYRISMTPWDMKGKPKHYASLQDVHQIKVSISENPRDSFPPMPMDVSTFARAASVPDFLDHVGTVSPILSPNFESVTPVWSPSLMPGINTAVSVVATADEHLGSTNSLDHKQMESVSSFHPSKIKRRHSDSDSFSAKSPDSFERPKSVPTHVHHQSEKKLLRRVCLPPRPASVASCTKSCVSPSHQFCPQPKPRTSNVVETLPVQSHGQQLKSNLKKISMSTEALYTSSDDAYRPVPKPRKTKDVFESDNTPPKRHSKVTFANMPNVIHVSPTSPTRLDSMCSASQSQPKTISVHFADLPPPRPRKDSGPPKFVPPPPPAIPKTS